MLFRRKTTYENIYKWHRSNNGTCFYCYENKIVAVPFIDKKGICQECLDHCKVGHAGSDRHLIAHLTKGIRSHKDAVQGLKKLGIKLAPNGYCENVHYYMAINNQGIFATYQDFIYDNGDLATLGSDVIKKILNSYNDVEIYQDGEIRIIY